MRIVIASNDSPRDQERGQGNQDDRRDKNIVRTDPQSSGSEFFCLASKIKRLICASLYRRRPVWPLFRKSPVSLKFRSKLCPQLPFPLESTLRSEWTG